MLGQEEADAERQSFGSTQALSRLHQAFEVFIQSLAYLFLHKYDPTKFLLRKEKRIGKRKRSGVFTATKRLKVLSFAFCFFCFEPNSSLSPKLHNYKWIFILFYSF